MMIRINQNTDSENNYTIMELNMDRSWPIGKPGYNVMYVMNLKIMLQEHYMFSIDSVSK